MRKKCEILRYKKCVMPDGSFKEEHDKMKESNPYAKKVFRVGDLNKMFLE